MLCLHLQPHYFALFRKRFPSALDIKSKSPLTAIVLSALSPPTPSTPTSLLFLFIQPGRIQKPFQHNGLPHLSTIKSTALVHYSYSDVPGKPSTQRVYRSYNSYTDFNAVIEGTIGAICRNITVHQVYSSTSHRSVIAAILKRAQNGSHRDSHWCW